MKKVRIVITVILAGLMVFAWFSWLRGSAGRAAEYRSSIERAEANAAASLYQKAIADYDAALKLRETEDVRRSQLEMYRLAYADGTVTERAYCQAMADFCKDYKNNVDVWETLIRLPLRNGDYAGARSYCSQALRDGATSDAISAMKDEIDYSFRTKSKVYLEVVQSSAGYAAVFSGKTWGVLKPDGEWLHACDYVYAGPVGADQTALLTNQRGTRILGGKSVVEAILPDGVEAARLIADGLVPVRVGGRWRYFDVAAGSLRAERYDDVTSYCGGVAYVLRGGRWQAVDTEGNAASDAQFDEIVMLDSGEYAVDDIMVARRGKDFGLYGADGAPVSDFTAPRMDACHGGLIAYQDAGGRWGFIDRKGEIAIAPAYEAARSFSGGLAAVKVDGTWGYINETGKLVIANAYQDAGYFSSKGVSFVSEVSGEYYMIVLRFGG